MRRGGVRVFKTKPFNRFATREDISDTELCDAVLRADRGLVDANLGGGVIKQRLARPGQGKASGFRSIVVFRAGDRAFFVYGFRKNKEDNISREELIAFRKLAGELLSYEEKKRAVAMANGVIVEIRCDE